MKQIRLSVTPPLEETVPVHQAIQSTDVVGEAAQPIETPTDDPLNGLTIVFTGSLDRFTRSDAQELVERYGANATTSVSGATDYLVAGDNPGANKLESADEHDTTVLDETEFATFLEERDVPHE